MQFNSNNIRPPRLLIEAVLLYCFSPQRLTHRRTRICLTHRIEMAVDIRRRAHIRVPQPFLNLLHRHTLRQQHRCARVPQGVEADLLQIVLFRKNDGGLSFLSGIKPH